MNYGGLKNNFASLIFLVMILSLVLTEAGEDPNDKGPDLISHLNLISIVQGVPTSLGYAKYNVLKPRKVCERSELRLQNIELIKKGEFPILIQ